MRILFGLASLAALAATSASAQPGPLSDVAYLQAARCVGLASSKALGSNDVKGMTAWLQSESMRRQPFIVDKGDEMERQAKYEADRADDMAKPRLQAELSGQCASLKG